MSSRRTDLPLYLGLYEDIKDRIVSGELAAGEKLPSIRAMARDLNVSNQVKTGSELDKRQAA